MAESQSDTAALPGRARVVVGLDFGTTYSGFAFANASDLDKVHTFYDYPDSAEEKRSCKTLTACYYKPNMETATSAVGASWKLQSWGYPARSDYERDIQALHKYRSWQELEAQEALLHARTGDTSQRGVGDAAPSAIPHEPSVGVLLSKFKLHLASTSTHASSATPLPPGLPVAQVITDYLRELGGLVLEHLQSIHGAHFNSEMIWWCISVPSIWDNSVKTIMTTCMAATGLVSAHHPMTTVQEPEAASFYFQSVLGEVVLKAGFKFLIADIGGGISDIVVQEVVKPGCLVKEVTMSSGGLCGSTYMDSRFMEYLKTRVGNDFVTECILKHGYVYEQLMKEWECIKSTFDHGYTVMNLPNKLAVEWARLDRESGRPRRREYDQLVISSRKLQSIFDPVVQQIVDLIQRQMMEVGGEVHVLVMVGGFSESPYLLRRIRGAFGAAAQIIMCPPNPGSAICLGAVTLALKEMSRICNRTYGFQIGLPYEKGIDPKERLLTLEEDGTHWCLDQFEVFVTKGDVVLMGEAVTTIFQAFVEGYTSVELNLFSCDDMLPPKYITDEGMQKEGKLEMDLSGDMGMGDFWIIEVSMRFGEPRSEVQARAVNFQAEQVQLEVEVDYLLH